MDELHYEDALQVGKRLQDKELTSVELTQSLLERIEAKSDLSAFVTMTADHAISQAQQADSEIAAGKFRSALHGVPVALKDLLATKDITTTNGMAVYFDNKPDYDATVVSRLSEAGTVLLGKLKLTEGAFSRHHPLVEVPRNPFDAECWAGVSSSGSGVATAAGLCFASLGTDTGGSIRFPSAANGIVGLKPTWGRVSRFGAFPLAYSLDHIGPMTRSVADAAAVLGIIAGQDSMDATSSPQPVEDYLAALDSSIRGLRIGIDDAYIAHGVDEELVRAVNEVKAGLQSEGCEIVNVSIPYAEISAQWMVTTAVEVLHAHKDTYPSRKAEYGHIAGLLGLAETLPAEAYMQADMIRRAFAAQLESIFQQCDLLLCPSMTLYAPPREGTPEMDNAESDLAQTLKFTAPFDYSGSPTLSIPWKPGSKTIPTSVQLVGRHFSESTLISVGSKIELMRGALVHPD